MVIFFFRYNYVNRYINLLIIIILSWSIITPAAFSQQKEFLRLRSTAEGTVPTTPAYTTGGESPVEYYISAGDKLEIYIWQNPDLTRDVTVRSDGKLSYPLIGTFKASGLTIDQFQELLTQRFSQYIRAPQITVTVKEAVGNKIIVLGQVNYPGIYTFKGTINLLDAVALAGDFTPDGRRESVMVISDNFTPNPKVRKIDMLTAIRQGVSKEDIFLKPNDVVYVPRSTIADFNKFMTEIYPGINALSSIFQLGTNASAAAVSARSWFLHRNLKSIDAN